MSQFDSPRAEAWRAWREASRRLSREQRKRVFHLARSGIRVDEPEDRRLVELRIRAMLSLEGPPVWGWILVALIALATVSLVARLRAGHLGLAFLSLFTIVLFASTLVSSKRLRAAYRRTASANQMQVD
jgi:hypothetical protein